MAEESAVRAVAAEPDRGAGSPAVPTPPVDPDRLEEVLAVLHGGFATELAAYGINRENTPSNPAFWELATLERLLARPAELLTIEGKSGQVVGCAFVLASRSRPGTWELRHLAVLPEERHAGHGEQLVLAAVDRARSAGAQVLRIGIVAENARLSAWYRGLGFATTDIASYPGLPFTVEHLELPLQ